MKIDESCKEPARDILQTDRATSSFYVPGTSDSFNERQKNIFGVLDTVETESSCNRYTVEDFKSSEVRLSRTVSNSKREMKQFRGQESIFKKPEAPMPGRWKRKMADFQINPHKWTKYSLEDVKIDDESNKVAAMTFLREVSQRVRQEVEEPGPASSPPKRCIFNKHVKELNKEKEKKEEEDEEKPTFISGKYVMPEYVVGQKVNKKKSTVKKVEASGDSGGSRVKLDHLLEEDQD